MLVEVPEIEQLISDVAALREEIADLRQAVRPVKSWYTLAEACELKGVTFNTIKNNRHLQPARGHGERVGKRIRFPAALVHSWALKTDEELEHEIVRKKSA